MDKLAKRLHIQVEVPVFKRCCYCIPLRYGLLVWGYIKLVLTLVVFLFGALVLQMYLQLFFMFGISMWPVILVGSSLMLFFMVDLGMTVVFLIGGHRKTTKLLNIFYIYSIILLSIISVLLLISTVYDLSVGDAYNEQYRQTHHQQQMMSYGTLVTTKLVIGLVFLGVQAYIIILIRSEINKLKNGRNFRFTNITAEACTMENRNNEPEIDTQVLRSGMEDREIGMDDELEGNFTKSKSKVTKEGNFSYDQF